MFNSTLDAPNYRIRRCRHDELVIMTLDDIEDKETMLLFNISNTKTITNKSFIVNSGRDL